jgi:beta-phosphoglucomutase
MKFDAVVFDMDGVLLDATEWHFDALNEALTPFGYEIARQLHESRLNGLSTARKLQILTHEFGFPSELHDIVSRVKQDRTLRIAAQKCFPNPTHLILLNRLQNLGLRLGVCTNSIRQTTQVMLDKAGVDKFISVTITNEDVKSPKPDPEGYLLACHRLSVKPERTLVIEDGHYGVAAATAAGCKVFQVNHPNDVSVGNISLEIPELLQ